MILEWLNTVQWDHPAIVGPVAAAITTGIFLVVNSILNRKKTTDTTSANANTNENRISNDAKQTVNVHLDQKPLVDAVGKEVGKVLEPIMEMITAKQKVPDTGDPLKIKAIECYNDGIDASNEGDKGQAMGLWRAAIKLDPEYAPPRNAVGVFHADNGDHDDAIKHYNKALLIDPNYVKAHSNLGVAMDDKGDQDGAIQHYNAALKIDPNDANAHYNLGLALKAKGKLDGSIEHYNAAIRTDPVYAKAHYNLAIALALKKDTAGAVAALARAIELNHGFPNWAKTETDFDAIRDDAAFRKLVYGEGS